MYPSSFDYYRAGSVDEALALLQQHDGAKLIAGGHSLLPMMKLRLAEPTALIDIARIPGLNNIAFNGDGGVTIGALTTYEQIEGNVALKGSYPALTEAAGLVGDIQVRNRGTIGGGLAHADPASDLPAVILAYNGTLKAVSRSGWRSIMADNFFVGMLTTALEPGEVLTEITLPAQPSGTGSAYAKFPHPASGYAIVGVAAVVTISGDFITGARVAVTGAGPNAVRLTGVESALVGHPTFNFASLADRAADGLDLNGDIHASADYRAHLVNVFTRRALEAAVSRA